MSELEEVTRRIEELKNYLNNIMELKQTPLDPDVIAASKMLDTVLNEYFKLIKHEIKSKIAR